MDFCGKNILVTGAAHRAGEKIARAFASCGAHVVVHAFSHFSEAKAVAASLPGTGHTALRADLADAQEAEKLFREAGKIDVLVNNASFFRLFPTGDPAENGLFRQINEVSPRRLMELFVRQGLAEGAVVNVLDAAIFSREDDPYTASRRRLAESTLDFARKYGPGNLRFNAVAPGPMLPPQELPQSKMEKIVRHTALLRKVEVGDFVSAVLFLAGCDSVTGAILPVDCGQSLIDGAPWRATELFASPR